MKGFSFYRSLVVIGAVALVSFGCGKKKDSATDASSDLLLTDSSVSGQAVNSQVALSFDAVAEEESSSTSALRLTGDGAKVQRYRKCTQTDQTAVAEVDLDYSYSISLTLKKGTFSADVVNSDRRTRTWSREGGSVACNTAGTFAKIDFTDMNGLQLVSQLTQSSTFEFKSTDTNGNVLKDAKGSGSYSGQRTIKWSQETSSDNTLTIGKESSFSFSGTGSYQKNDGSTFQLQEAHATKDGEPLETTVTRTAGTFVLTTVTLKSGTVVTTHGSGTRIETTFKNVVLNANTGADRCKGASGEIDGAIYSTSTDTTPAKTFTITFGSGTTQITYSDGDTVSFSASGCELNKQSGTFTDVTTKPTT